MSSIVKWLLFLLVLALAPLTAESHPQQGSGSAVKYGVFARAYGTSPFGMFTPSGKIDRAKAQHIVDIGASWTRFETSPFFVDQTIYGPGRYAFDEIDKLDAWQVAHHIEPVFGIEAGPVQVNATQGTFSPHQVSVYPNATQFATFCFSLARHMSARGTNAYSEPGNEVNTDTGKFPNGAASVAPYARDCYQSIKRADAHAFVWGLELSMDAKADAPAFVAKLAELGCGRGTCYDGISMHLALRYPIPPVGTPCYPNPGGDYSVACIADVQHAAGDASLPIMIGETVVTWPGMVRDAATQSLAVAAQLRALAAVPSVKYINYANLDECGLYESGYFANGCLVDKRGARVGAWQPVHAIFSEARNQTTRATHVAIRRTHH